MTARGRGVRFGAMDVVGVTGRVASAGGVPRRVRPRVRDPGVGVESWTPRVDLLDGIGPEPLPNAPRLHASFTQLWILRKRGIGRWPVLMRSASCVAMADHPSAGSPPDNNVSGHDN